jgi:hypothetical protein
MGAKSTPTERQRLVSRVAAAFRLKGISEEYEMVSQFVAEWLDAHKVEGETADRLGIDSVGRWKRFVLDVMKAAKSDV